MTTETLYITMPTTDRNVSVEHDGTIRVINTVVPPSILGEEYTIHHDLTDAEVTEARRLASLVRAGTHRIDGGGYVRAKATA